MSAPRMPRMTVMTMLMFCLPGSTMRARTPMTAPNTMRPRMSPMSMHTAPSPRSSGPPNRDSDAGRGPGSTGRPVHSQPSAPGDWGRGGDSRSTPHSRRRETGATLGLGEDDVERGPHDSAPVLGWRTGAERRGWSDPTRASAGDDPLVGDDEEGGDDDADDQSDPVDPAGVLITGDSRVEPAADEGAEDAEDHGDQGRDVLLAGQDQTRQGADDRAENDGHDDGGQHCSYSFWGPGDLRTSCG